MDNRDAARKLFRFYELRHTGNTLATDIGANVRGRRTPVDRGPGTSATATVHRIVPPLAAPAGAARRR